MVTVEGRCDTGLQTGAICGATRLATPTRAVNLLFVKYDTWFTPTHITRNLGPPGKRR